MSKYKVILKDSEDYDYGTGDVKGTDIFDISTTGCSGTWENLLRGIDTAYYKNNKNLVGEIVYMTPTKYYSLCSKMFRNFRNSNTSPEDLKSQRGEDKATLEYLKKIILEKKKKFPIPVIDVSHSPGQEGLHRMMVAGDLFGWDTEFPVLYVKTYDQRRQDNIEKNYEQNQFNSKVEKVLSYIEDWEFYDYDEFYTILTDKLEDYPGIEDITLTTKGNILEISSYNDKIDDTLIYEYDLNNIKVEN